jgi:hypothetical protein
VVGEAGDKEAGSWLEELEEHRAGDILQVDKDYTPGQEEEDHVEQVEEAQHGTAAEHVADAATDSEGHNHSLHTKHSVLGSVVEAEEYSIVDCTEE